MKKALALLARATLIEGCVIALAVLNHTILGWVLATVAILTFAWVLLRDSREEAAR